MVLTSTHSERQHNVQSVAAEQSTLPEHNLNCRCHGQSLAWFFLGSWVVLCFKHSLHNSGCSIKFPSTNACNMALSSTFIAMKTVFYRLCMFFFSHIFSFVVRKALASIPLVVSLSRIRKVPLGFPNDNSCLSASFRPSLPKYHLKEISEIVRKMLSI